AGTWTEWQFCTDMQGQLPDIIADHNRRPGVSIAALFEWTAWKAQKFAGWARLFLGVWGDIIP
ncbi:MAG: hypothetical protein AAB528_05710, partial [Chloroflexota bacterium]